MLVLIITIIATSGTNSLLLPASSAGITTSFASSQYAEAVFYNPANIKTDKDFDLYCSYNRFYLSMQSVALSMTKKIKTINLGLAFINFDYGDIEWHPNYPSEDSLTFYTANDFSIIVSTNLPISKNGNIGLNVKYISENIYIYSDYALAFDVGASYSKERYTITFGASNCGTKISLNNEAVNLPARLSLGGLYHLKKFKVSADLHYLVNNGIFEFSLGLGIPLYEILYFDLAAQYRENFYPGFGLTLKTDKLSFKYGGALYPRDLGIINTLGIGFEF